MVMMKELREDDKFSVWSGKFERSNSLTLIKGYFQQWIPTPDNFSSLIVVRTASIIIPPVYKVYRGYIDFAFA